MTDAIRNLLELSGDLGVLLDTARLNLPCGEFTSVVLSVEDILRALAKNKCGDITFGQLEEWSEYFENNDAIDYAEQDRELIASVLFRLSSPEVNAPLTQDYVQMLIDELSARP